MDNNIYLLYSCDTWKSWSSMRLVVATTDTDKLNQVIVNEIKKGNMEFGHLDYEEAVEEFEREYDYDRLDYGYVECVTDGEVQ